LSLPTGGQAEIAVTAPSGVNSGSRFERLNLMSGGQVCLNISNSAYWTLVNSQIACQSYAIQVSDANAPDAGDSTIYGNLIQSSIGGTAILWQSSGGLRVSNNKILGYQMTYGIFIYLAPGANTADIFVEGNSIEGVAGVGIQLNRQGSTSGLGTVVITGNELSGEYCVFAPTDASGVWLNNMVVTSNVCLTFGTAGFSLDSVQGLVVANNFIQSVGSTPTTPVGVGPHGPTSTNCVVGPNPHLGPVNASSPGPCTAIAPN
jgi:Right handed beta helix region